MLQIIQEDSQVKLTFLHQHGSSSSYKYPGTQDIRTVPISNILTIVDPRSRSGRVYTISKDETKLASERLKATTPKLMYFIIYSSVNIIILSLCNANCLQTAIIVQ